MIYISLLAMVFYGFDVLQNVAGEETSTLCKYDYNPCSHYLCCCLRDLTYSEGHGKRLTYIPTVPDRTRSFDFRNNIRPTLSREVIVNISTLEIKLLYLMTDQVISITEDAFQDIDYLTRLNLSSNKNIYKTHVFFPFGSLPNLQVLNLQNIDLDHTIHIDFLKRLQNASVSKLVSDNNELTYVNVTVFKDLPRLTYFRLANTLIEHVHTNDGYPCLNALHMTKHEITRYPPQYCRTNHSMFPVLHDLYLDNNYISILGHDFWKCLDSLKLLGIGGNCVGGITKHVISSNLTSLTEIRVDFFLYSLSNIELEEGMDMSLDISYNSNEELTELFSSLTKLQRLYMISTYLRSISRNFLTNFTDLEFSNVNGNDIQNFSDACNGLTELRSLSIQRIPWTIRKTLMTLNLADNALDCIYENFWIGDQGMPLVTNRSLKYNILTFFPNCSNGTHFKTFRPTKAPCETNHILLIICVSMGSALVVVAVTIPVGFRYKWHILYMAYTLSKRNERDPEIRALLGETGFIVEPYTYVIYHDNDSRFVHNDICDLVEKELGLKLYIWHRDAPLGCKATIMFEAIHSSANILAIISNNFVTDGWCEFQLNIGLVKQNEKREDCLTLLVLEDLDCSLLRRSWCVTLVRNATAYWCSDKRSIKKKLCSNRLSTRLARNGNESLILKESVNGNSLTTCINIDTL